MTAASEQRGWEAVIGLEVHVQLATASKIFSNTAVTSGAPVNEKANLVDVAIPGTLPVLNLEAVRKAVRFGLAIDAEIAAECRFDRKNYFYPDLPKGYQISQLDHPIVGRGELVVILEDGNVRKVGITRAHLEEDAGKSIHERFDGATGIDLNRAGTPLMEIVTEPDLRSPQEAAACFRQLHTLVTWLELCDGDLSQGSMRCDANVSVRRQGTTTLGERTEIKNVNSFRFVEKALAYEISRQIDLLEDGDDVVRETRLYDAERDETRPMRGKELSDDYRYFPDPDLLPMRIDASFLDSVRNELPELPDRTFARFVEQFRLPDSTAARLTATRATAKYFEDAASRTAAFERAANWILGDLSASLNRAGLGFDRVPLDAQALAQLVNYIEDGTLSSKMGKLVFEEAWDSGEAIDDIVGRRGLRQISDAQQLTAIVESVIEKHPDQVAQYRAGKTKVMAFLVGQVMRETRGRANPQKVNELLNERVDI